MNRTFVVDTHFLPDSVLAMMAVRTDVSDIDDFVEELRSYQGLIIIEEDEGQAPDSLLYMASIIHNGERLTKGVDRLDQYNILEAVLPRIKLSVVVSEVFGGESKTAKSFASFMNPSYRQRVTERQFRKSTLVDWTEIK